MPARRPRVVALLLTPVLLGHAAQPRVTATPAAADVAVVDSVPLAYDDARVWVPVRVGAGPTRWFVLDTGAGPTLVDAALARALGLGVAAAGVGEGAGTAQVARGRATVAALAVGTRTFAPLDVVVAPLDSLIGPFTGRVFPGIVGSRFFADRVVELDWERGVVRSFAPGAYRAPAGTVAVPLEIADGIPYAAARLALPDGAVVPLRVLVDLGAKATLLVTEPFVERHRLADRLGPGVIATLGAGMGGETRYRFVRAPGLWLGSGDAIHAEPVVAALSVGRTLRATGYDALLGVEFLRRYRVAFDYPGRRLLLAPLPNARAPAEFDMAGLYVVARGPQRRPEVLHVLAGGPADAAGVREGDVLLAADGAPVGAAQLGSLRELLRSVPGRAVRLRLLRDGHEREAVVRLRRLV